MSVGRTPSGLSMNIDPRPVVLVEPRPGLQPVLRRTGPLSFRTSVTDPSLRRHRIPRHPNPFPNMETQVKGVNIFFLYYFHGYRVPPTSLLSLPTGLVQTVCPSHVVGVRDGNPNRTLRHFGWRRGVTLGVRTLWFDPVSKEETPTWSSP